jgi:hypothetical protein
MQTAGRPDEENMRDRKFWILALAVAFVLPLAGCDLFDDEDCDEVVVDDAWVELIDGNVYNMRYSCEVDPVDGDPFCDRYQEVDALTMEYLGDGDWEGVLEVVEGDDLVVRGSFDGTVFEWTAVSEGDAGTSGAWDFSSDGETFEGGAAAESSEGTIDCLILGVLAPDDPPLVDDFGTCID